MIRPSLINKINDHKTQLEWKIHSGYTVIDYKIKGEWKIQLTMATNFFSLKDSEETCIMNTKSDSRNYDG